MTLPSLLFALLIALLFGALYHFLRGGGFWRLILCLGFSILGFTLGQLIGLWQNWIFFPLGPLNLGMSSIGSLVILIIGDWLTRTESKPESTVQSAPVVNQDLRNLTASGSRFPRSKP